MEEYKLYKNAEENYKNVSRGGKYYHNCSYMDVEVRSKRKELVEKVLIEALGKKVFVLLKETEK